MGSQWKVRFLDLSVKTEPELDKYAADLKNILRHGQIILGPEVEIFEQQIAHYCQRRFAVGVGSGTDALICAIKCLELPIGSEIITTPLSWVASTNAITLSGMKAVFADIDDTLNINMDSTQQLITSKTKAILSVDFAGQPCNYPALVSICNQYGLKLIQDASQALGAMDKLGMTGSHGDVSAISHNPMKTLSGFGEAGSVLTNSEKYSEFLNILRYAGTINREDCIIPATNARLDTIQASFLSTRLRYLEEIIERRNKIAERYSNELPPEITRVAISSNTVKHAYYTYQVLYPRRDELINTLTEMGIETKVQHRLLIPQQQYYSRMGFKVDGSYAEEISKTSLCLPCNENLGYNEQSLVINAVHKAVKTN